MVKKFIFTAAAIFLILQAGNSYANWNLFKSDERRTYIYIVGSSTISPFMSAISEEFSRAQNLKNILTATPVVESTGTHNGFKLFCAGIGYQYPDFVNASSPIRPNEVEECVGNGVKEIVEIKIGYDGIVIGNSSSSKKIKLTKEQIFLALAEKIFDKKSKKLIKNPYKTWHEINSSLPKTGILFYGPPLTSGTRDVFSELVMEEVCMNKQEFVASFLNHEERKKQCAKIRDDGAFIESGENDNLTVQNLKNNPQVMGILGFNFLIKNRGLIQAIKINNVEPTVENIESKRYELSRPLFVYFKKQHLNLIPGMHEFLAEIVSPETIGRKGYLLHSGLISLSDSELLEVRKNIFPDDEK